MIMDNNSIEAEPEHLMEVEINEDVDVENVDYRPLSPVFSYNHHEHIQAHQEIIIIDDRSRSPILTQHSTSSNLSDRDTASTTRVSDVSSPVISSVCTEDSDSDKCECKCNKENKQKVPKNISDEYEDDEGKLCPICLDIWTNSGEHRVCALRCGHLFGHSCLERWLSGQRTCPTCKRTVKKTDIRFIYAKKLIAMDTTELTVLKLELDTEKCERNRLQIELIQSKQREDLQRKEVVDLRKQVEILKTSTRYINGSQGSTITNDWKIYKEKYFEVSKDGGCRVMDYYKLSNILVVSAHSPNPLFSGYGIRKVHVNDFKNSCYIPLHSAMIRDLSFHPQRELLLSVAVDKCVRLTETANSKSVHTVQCSGPVWSCCWDATNPNYFYIGEQSGSAVKYDIRKASEKLNTLQVPGDFSPVVSIASAGWCPGAALPQGGVIVCKLNSCAVFSENANSGDFTMHPLCLDGPFVSMRYDNITGHLLVTSRPNIRYPFSRHTVCTLPKDIGYSDSIICNTVQVFQGAPVQKLLSRSCQINIAGDVLVSAHQESNKVVDIWSVATGKKINSLPAYAPILDMSPVFTDSAQYLCTLNEKKVDFFKLELS